MDSFVNLMFGDQVRAEQAKRGAAEAYDRMKARPVAQELGAEERAFIETRDSFYLATTGESGWPYVQHRGGPAGFLRVIGPDASAFADYRSNRQYVSTGHVVAADRVSLFLMDYPRKGRLRLLGHASIDEADAVRELAASLTAQNAPAPERVVTVRMVAWDWNCPKYITPRFAEAEIDAMLNPRLEALALENATLRGRIAELEREDHSA